MAHSRVASLLTIIFLSAAQAQQPAHDDKQEEAVYDIRDLVEKSDSPAFASLGRAALKDNAELRAAEPARKAALIVEALFSAIDRAGGKPTAADRESIQVLNGTRLVVRASAARHALIADVLQTFRRLSDVAVFVKAQLYEADNAFYTRLKNVKRADLDELERQQTLNPPKGETLFKLLEKQQLILAGEEIKMDNGQAAALLSRHQAIPCAASPDQVRKAQTGRQTVWEGVSFLARMRVSHDRRFVHVKLTEKAAELQDILKVKVRDATGKQADAEVPFLLESAHSQVLDIPDGGSILVPVHYRPRSVQEKGRWWVLRITPRIAIEEEERVIREGFLSPILREVAADVLHNPRLKTAREFYGTAGDKRFALVNSAAWTWPKEFRPDMPGYQLTPVNRAGQRLLGIRVETVQDARNGPAIPAIAVTLVNAGESANGAVIGGCTIRYTARQKGTGWVVELSESLDP